MSIKDKIEPVITPVTREVKKKFVALKTTKITCNGVFDLIEGKEIPTGINKAFIQSLVNSKLIK